MPPPCHCYHTHAVIPAHMFACALAHAHTHAHTHTHTHSHTHTETDVYTDGIVKLCMVFTGPHSLTVTPCIYTHIHTHTHRCTWYCEAVCGIYRPPPCRHCHTQCLHNLPRPPSGKSDRLLEFDACSAVVKKAFEIYCLVYKGVTQLHITDQ